ncbi:MAG TPA: GNAT family N-acetyltransferase [Candidatus Acidoferrum sp.]
MSKLNARISQEVFPPPVGKSTFSQLFNLHGIEVQGRPFKINYARYTRLEFEGRLVWIVARDINSELPIGYSCSFWYYDLHYYDEKVASDDIWFVDKEWRNRGIGTWLKHAAHTELKRHGVKRVSDVIRGVFDHPNLMRDLGFVNSGVKWVKTL